MKKVCESCRIELSKIGITNPDCSHCCEQEFKNVQFSFELECNSNGKREVLKEINKFLESMHSWDYKNVKAIENKESTRSDFIEFEDLDLPIDAKLSNKKPMFKRKF